MRASQRTAVSDIECTVESSYYLPVAGSRTLVPSTSCTSLTAPTDEIGFSILSRIIEMTIELMKCVFA